MKEIFNPNYIAEAVGKTNQFLQAELGTELQGSLASHDMAAIVESTHDRVSDFLTSRQFPGQGGWFLPLSSQNVTEQDSSDYDTAVDLLQGYFVIVPSNLVGDSGSSLYPAVVSPDSLDIKNPENSALRLHILRHPYKEHLHNGNSQVLSSAAQSETANIGGADNESATEPEHFITKLAATVDTSLYDQFQKGLHPSHDSDLRVNPSTSVISSFTTALFNETMPLETVTISRRQLQTGKTAIFWHTGLGTETAEGIRPETASKPDALIVSQALGFKAVENAGITTSDKLKKLLH